MVPRHCGTGFGTGSGMLTTVAAVTSIRNKLYLGIEKITVPIDGG